jgi:hypothetical protein
MRLARPIAGLKTSESAGTFKYKINDTTLVGLKICARGEELCNFRTFSVLY